MTTLRADISLKDGYNTAEYEYGFAGSNTAPNSYQGSASFTHDDGILRYYFVKNKSNNQIFYFPKGYNLFSGKLPSPTPPLPSGETPPLPTTPPSGTSSATGGTSGGAGSGTSPTPTTPQPCKCVIKTVGLKPVPQPCKCVINSISDITGSQKSPNNPIKDIVFTIIQ